MSDQISTCITPTVAPRRPLARPPPPPPPRPRGPRAPPPRLDADEDDRRRDRRRQHVGDQKELIPRERDGERRERRRDLGPALRGEDAARRARGPALDGEDPAADRGGEEVAVAQPGVPERPRLQLRQPEPRLCGDQ